MKNILLLSIFLFYSNFTFGKSFVEYDFTLVNGDDVSAPRTFIASNMTVSASTRGSEITANTGTNQFNARNWTTSSLDLNYQDMQ